jgi:flavin reductase (DIM6/NTAB) family NADH-FMN oxidoreductase RutF
VERQFETLRMEDLDVSEAYDLLTACISPRPIGFISSISAMNVPNLAPFSFFTIGGANPPSVIFSAVVNLDGSQKETFRNVSDTGEFVVNSVHRDMLDGVHRAAEKSTLEMPKWDRSGFGQLPSLVVRPPRVAESQIQLECKVFDVIEHGSGPGAARYVVGEVLVAHVSPDLMMHGRLDPSTLRLIARLAGKSYVDTERLEIFAPEEG